MSIYDKASLVLIPSGTKTSKVYSQKPVNGDGDFTFSRSTAATRVNADGNIEKETQNLLLQSNTFSNAAWSKFSNTTYTVTTETITDPFGVSNSVYKVTLTGSGYFFLRQTLNGETRYITASTYIKKSSSDLNVTVDQSDGDVTNSASNTDWQRLSSTHASGYTFSFIDIVLTGVSGDYYYVSSAQMELGGAARDYIETTAAAVEGGITDNVPRLDYTDSSCPALLLEPQRSNLETQSEYFGGWSVNSNITRTSNYIVSPDGTQNATRLQFTANGFCANKTQSLATYTISCYAKRNDSGTQNVGFFTNGSGVVNSAWAVTSEWKRFSYTFPTLNGSFMGIAGLSGADISVYGFQIEGLATYATSYIPTYGTSVTRVDDESKVAYNAIAGLNEATLVVEYTIPIEQPTGLNHIAGYRDNSNADFYILQLGNSNNHELRWRGQNGTAVSLIAAIDEATYGLHRKIAFVKTNDKLIAYCNGIKVTETSAGATNAFSTNASEELDLWYSGFVESKPIKQLLVIPSALSNQEAIDLTTI